MGRADKKLVREAQLFGSYQRRINLRAGEVADGLDEHIAELGQAVSADGGDPEELWAAVVARNEDLKRSAKPVDMPVMEDQAEELRRRALTNQRLKAEEIMALPEADREMYLTARMALSLETSITLGDPNNTPEQEAEGQALAVRLMALRAERIRAAPE